MADIAWRGDLQSTEQVTTIAVTGTWATNDTATLTINGKDLTLTVGSATTTSDVVAALVAMVNGSAVVGTETRNETGNNIPEWSGITASGSASPLTLTGDTTRPFTVTVSESTAGDGALGAPSTTTSPTSPNTLAAENVTGGTLPGAADTFTLANSSVSMLYGLDQSSAGTLASVSMPASFTGHVGLRRYNSLGFVEYLDREYNVRCSALTIGAGGGSGSGLIAINLGNVQCAVKVIDTASSAETDYHAVRLRGTHASNTLEVIGGTVDVAAEAGQTATFATLNASGSSEVRTSSGTTLTTVNASGSAVVDITSAAALSDITTINISDSAVVYLRGDNAVGTINVYGGTLYLMSSGTITNLNVGPTGVVDVTQSTVAVTVTNASASPGATITDKQKRITWTNGIDLGNAGLEDFGNLNLGRGITITPS